MENRWPTHLFSSMVSVWKLGQLLQNPVKIHLNIFESLFWQDFPRAIAIIKLHISGRKEITLGLPSPWKGSPMTWLVVWHLSLLEKCHHHPICHSHFNRHGHMICAICPVSSAMAEKQQLNPEAESSSPYHHPHYQPSAGQQQRRTRCFLADFLVARALSIRSTRAFLAAPSLKATLPWVAIRI